MKRVHEFICDVCGKHKRHEDNGRLHEKCLGTYTLKDLEEDKS